MPRTILVPLDGSRFAEQALPTAVALAARTGARLVLTRVHVPLPFEVSAGQEPMEAELLASENAYLREWVVRLAGRGIPVFAVALPGPVPFAIRVAAESCSGVLVVMASHRRGPIARAFHGSTAGSIIRRSGAPVLVVGRSARTDATFTRVLIPLDGSAATGEAALSAFDLAGPVEYIFVHGTRNRSDGPGAGRVDAAAHASVRRVRARLEGLGARTSVERVRQASVVEAIARMTLPGDLIAMTTRRGTVGRLVFGHTADEIMRAAPHVAALTWQPDRRRRASPSVLPAPRAADSPWRGNRGIGVPRDAARPALSGVGAGGIAS